MEKSADQTTSETNPEALASDSEPPADSNKTPTNVGAITIPPSGPGTSDSSIPTTPATPRQLTYGPYSGRYHPRSQAYRLTRDMLREIASTTLDAFEEGSYYPPTREIPEDMMDEGRMHPEATEKKEHISEQEEVEEEGTKTGEAHEEEEKKEGEEAVEAPGSGLEEVHRSEEESRGRRPYDLKRKIIYTITHTQYFGPEDERLSRWADVPLWTGRDNASAADGCIQEDEEDRTGKTKIIIGEYSTLVGARRLSELAQNKGRIGVLNFASAKRAGGGFMNGAQAQEESLARSSTLYPSLLACKQFYNHYASDPDNAFYTPAMIYSPSIILFRDDRGSWTEPVEVDILTSAAVNAGDVRKQVRWEEEMRALRERVRVAELARGRDVSVTPRPPAHVRVYEYERVKDDRPTEGAGISQTEQQQETTISAPISPIIFASDPDPSPPLQPLSQPAATAASSQSHPSHLPSERPREVDLVAHAEMLIASTMYERIARILCLFHAQGARHLVLGSFGTGVFQNSVELVAGIFRDLLCEPTVADQETQGSHRDADGGGGVGKGKFKNAFDTVMFAILGGSTVRTFERVFEGAEGVELDEEAEGSDVDGMKDMIADSVVLDGRDPA